MNQNTAVNFTTTSKTWQEPEEIRPAIDVQLADALAKQSEVSSQAAKAAETFLTARANWLNMRSQLDRIAEDVARLRSEHDA